MKTTLTLILLLGLACTPGDNETAESDPPRAVTKQLLASFEYSVHLLTVDGVEYLVVDTPTGVSICPKVFPASNPQPE